MQLPRRCSAERNAGSVRACEFDWPFANANRSIESKKHWESAACERRAHVGCASLSSDSQVRTKGHSARSHSMWESEAWWFVEYGSALLCRRCSCQLSAAMEVRHLAPRVVHPLRAPRVHRFWRTLEHLTPLGLATQRRNGGTG